MSSCTKSQLLALLTRIKKEIDSCKTLDCAKNIVNNYKQMIEEHAMSEVWREIISP